jgi:hypothetical protein
MQSYGEITFKDIKSAYLKLKSMAYYDSSDLFLKAKIAEFETETVISENEIDFFEIKSISFEDKLVRLHEALEIRNKGEYAQYWKDLLNQIQYRVLPKKLLKTKKNSEENASVLINNFFSNNREKINYEFEKIILFIDAPIELHIMSVLWMMKLGCNLEEDLIDKCYGNRLILDPAKTENKERKIVSGSGLYKPYYKQYQKWRDEGISLAKNYLENGQDILFINIDIKDYYYSVRLNLNILNERLKDYYYNSYSILVEIFNKIHLKYTAIVSKVGYPDASKAKILEDETLLPIGLASSYLLANWYLREFDNRLHQNINPIYYSRYVDDIFIVLANPDFKYLLKEKCKEIRRHFDKKYGSNKSPHFQEFEQYILFVLDPVISLEYCNSNSKNDTNTDIKNYIFKLTCYENLYIQPNKTLIYHFEHTSSLALIEKFKDDIEKRSSEFRFLPDEEVEKKDFEDEAYELVYDESQLKIKTLKDYKENRYGLATHLVKKILFSLKSGKKNNKKEAKNVLRFFKGSTNLENYQQWEKLITYFIVNENHEEFIKYYTYTLSQLISIDSSENYKNTNVSLSKISRDLMDYLSISIEISLSLYPNFLNNEQKNKFRAISYQINDLTENKCRIGNILYNYRIFRHSNLLRHHFVVHPLMNYTNLSKSDNISLLEHDLTKIKGISTIQFDDLLIEYTPRHVKFWECALLEFYRLIHIETENDLPPYLLRYQIDLFKDENNYLNSAFERYYEINYWYIENEAFKNNLRNSILTINIIGHGQTIPNFEAQEILVNSDSLDLEKFKVGLANIKVRSEDFTASMLGRPNLFNRYGDISKVLNTAEHERDCNMIVLPELILPYSFLKFVTDWSSDKRRAIITGIEHWTVQNVSYNFILTLLPVTIMGINDSVPVFRLKNHYAPKEEFIINDYRRIVPKPHPYRYFLFRWRGLYFAVYYCYELADILHRSIFKSKVDLLIASEWNPDINYFSNITEATSRDIHCFFIQVNTSQYGDSRVNRPTKTANKDSLRIKGGKNIAVLIDELNIPELRAFQYLGFGQQQNIDNFKPTPPDFNHEDARKRSENRSFV